MSDPITASLLLVCLTSVPHCDLQHAEFVEVRRNSNICLTSNVPADLMRGVTTSRTHIVICGEMEVAENPQPLCRWHYVAAVSPSSESWGIGRKVCDD